MNLKPDEDGDKRVEKLKKLIEEESGDKDSLKRNKKFVSAGKDDSDNEGSVWARA